MNASGSGARTRRLTMAALFVAVTTTMIVLGAAMNSPGAPRRAPNTPPHPLPFAAPETVPGVPRPSEDDGIDVEPDPGSEIRYALWSR